MSFKVMQQEGFRGNWNTKSIHSDRLADGVILSPRHSKRIECQLYDRAIRLRSLFDPQFFFPKGPKGHLSDYDFYPSRVTDPYNETIFLRTGSRRCAEECVKFQIDSGFAEVIVPSMYWTGDPDHNLDINTRMFVSPFLHAIKESGTQTKVMLQVATSADTINQKPYRDKLLNWVTSFEDIHSVYLVVKNDSTSKQIKDPTYLFNLLQVIDSLRLADLKVVVGYSGCESFLLTIANPSFVTIGTYENTRKFNPEQFDPSVDKDSRGPTARIYIKKMLQWVDHKYLEFFERDASDLDLVDDSPYNIELFEPDYKWNFNKPQPYMHFLCVFGRQLDELSYLEGEHRFFRVMDDLHAVRSIGQEIESRGIALSADDDTSHVFSWITAANSFGKLKGWLP
jgi:hypothetical protein